MLTISHDALDIVLRGDDLPILSTIATRAITLIESGEATSQNLEELISADPALTSRILRVANSPFYTGVTKIGGIDHAVIRLGLAELKRTILLAATGELFDHKDRLVHLMWQHNVAVAAASHSLSVRREIGEPGECFVAGMLHDIGKLILYRHAPEPYGALIDEAMERSLRFYEHEREQINFVTHETAGAMVGQKWRLSPKVVHVIRFHHDVEGSRSLCDRADPVVALVSVANLIVNQLGFGAEDASAIDAAASIPAQALELESDDLERMHDEIRETIQEHQSGFG